MQLLASVAAREQADAQRARASGREQVPDAVADDDAVANIDADALRGGQEQVRVGLCVADVIARDQRRVRRQAEQLEREPGIAFGAAGGDRPRHAVFGECREQVARAGERPNALELLDVGLGVEAGEPGQRLAVQLALELARERRDEQAPAHPDPAVDLPDREIDADGLQCFAPGDDVLIDAVDQRAVEVEQECRLGEGLGRLAGSALGHAREPTVAALAASPVRNATSARTSGATSVPNNSIERITSACATAPTLIWPM